MSPCFNQPRKYVFSMKVEIQSIFYTAIPLVPRIVLGFLLMINKCALG
jgi:hypothetical protein